jgi:(2R)-ethylmalonyl-CoA mutase
VVGLSILSGSHLGLVPETLRLLRECGSDAPVVVGGIIPDADRAQLEAMGVARVYTPKDYRLALMMRDLAELAQAHRSKPQAGAKVGR